VLNHSRKIVSRPASATRCDSQGCQKASTGKLQDSSLCQEHFLAACHSRLAAISELVAQKRLDGTEAEEIRDFLTECTSGAVSQGLQPARLSNSQRARLLHIILSSAQVLMHLRRSPRIPRQVPLRLVGDPRTDPRVEDAMTQTVSQHGAMFRCEHPYTKGEILDIVRLDTGRSAIARVAWHQPIGPAHHHVAVEILNRSNFWN
jgi:hypothetical protein